MHELSRKIVAILAGLASVVGLLHPDLYRDAESVRTAWRPSDAVTLLVAVPLLLWAGARAEGESTRGRLVEIGALHYLLCELTFRVFGAELNALFPIYVAIVIFSFWTLALAVHDVDLGRVPRPPARGVAGWMLFVAGVLTIGAIAQSASGALARIRSAVDLTMMVCFLVPGAVLVFRRRPRGTLIGVALGVSGALHAIVVVGAPFVRLRSGLVQVAPTLVLWLVIAAGSIVATWRLVRRPDVCFVESS